MSMERIPADGWWTHAGHVARYTYATQHLRPGDIVNDVACGVGYGAAVLGPSVFRYRGYDRPGVPDVVAFGGHHPDGRVMEFREADLNDPEWYPLAADATVCFETLEHVTDPARLASVLALHTQRVIFVSVPTVPTVHVNPHHLHDFAEADVPPLFPGFAVAEVWAQPEELSHVWRLERA
jgi:hypothetical protein